MWQKLSCEQIAYVHNIQSPVKQEVDMLQIQKCLTRYSSPYNDALCQISGSWPLWFPRKMWQKLSLSKFAYVHNIQSRIKQEVDMPQIQKCVTRYSSPYWCSVQNIRKLASVVPEKNVTEIILWANLPMSTILKVASKTGSGHAADSKLRYTIQFSILMLCDKYQEAGLCGSRKKCDRNYLVSKFVLVSVSLQLIYPSSSLSAAYFVVFLDWPKPKP